MKDYDKERYKLSYYQRCNLILYNLFRGIGKCGSMLRRNLPTAYKILKPFFPTTSLGYIFVPTRKKFNNYIYRKELLEIADGVIWFGSDEKITFQPLKIVGENRGDVFLRMDKPYTIRKPFVCVMNNTQIAGPKAWGFTKDNRFIVETGIFFLTEKFLYPLRSEMAESKKYLNIPAQVIDETAVSLISEHSFSNYYHWVIERLTLLQAVEVYEKKTGIRPKLLVPVHIKPWQRETLGYLGYGEKDFIYWNGGRAIAKKLLIPSMRRYSEDKTNPYDALSPDACFWLREKFMKNVDLSKVSKTFSKKVYISRSRDTHNRILNEDALMNELKKYSFESYYMMDLSIPEQIKLFSGADIIVSAHGAALTNLLWSKKGTTIIEINFLTFSVLVYYQLAEILGLKHMALFPDDVNKTQDMTVDIEEIKKIVHDIV